MSATLTGLVKQRNIRIRDVFIVKTLEVNKIDKTVYKCKKKNYFVQSRSFLEIISISFMNDSVKYIYDSLFCVYWPRLVVPKTN